jgi:hypothetical protein
MLSWILTLGGIVAFSIITLEFLRETDETGWEETGGKPASHPRLGRTWETMADSDLERLLEEFRREGEAGGGAPEKLAA